MTGLYLYDDRTARGFEPFASTRPVSELRSGAWLIRDRWESLVQPSDGVFHIAGDRHADFDDGSPTRPAGDVIPAGSVVANARCAPALTQPLPRQGQRAATCTVWQSNGRPAAVRVRVDVERAAFENGDITIEELDAGTGGITEVNGAWHEHVWDLVRHLPGQLAADIACLAEMPTIRYEAADYRLPANVAVIGDGRVTVLGRDSTVIEPFVVFDTTGGPILIEAGTHVHSFTRIAGPCYIGRNVTVLGGDLSACSIGDVCKVRGEISNSVMLGYSNKGHDGFVGHSYFGRWVNLGAGTTTSNLKNTYGTVALWTPEGVQDTGMQFLGTLFGDHAKTGIGLQLTTGTVLGAGANVFGGMPPKAVSPFAWGGGAPYSVYQPEKFAETAARVMARRHVELSERGRRHLAGVHAARWTTDEGQA